MCLIAPDSALTWFRCMSKTEEKDLVWSNMSIHIDGHWVGIDAMPASAPMWMRPLICVFRSLSIKPKKESHILLSARDCHVLKHFHLHFYIRGNCAMHVFVKMISSSYSWPCTMDRNLFSNRTTSKERNWRPKRKDREHLLRYFFVLPHSLVTKWSSSPVVDPFFSYLWA